MKKWFWIGCLSLVFVGWGMVAYAEEDGGEDNPCDAGDPPDDICPWYENEDCGWECDTDDMICCKEISSEGCVCELKPEDECCDNCGDCSGGSCPVGGGSGGGAGGGGGGPAPLGQRSVADWGGKAEFNFSLGKKIGTDRKAGFLYVKIPGPVSNAASPRWLSFAGDAQAGVRAVVLGNAIRRVYAPEAGVSVVTTGSYAYELRFYSPGVLESAGESDPVEDPFTVWRVFDPDSGTNEHKRLTFLQLAGGQTNYLVEYEWTSANSMAWRTGGDLRTDELSWSYSVESGATNRLDVHLVRNSDGTVAERTVRTYRHYVFGDKPIRVQKGAEGAEITTAEVEYYDDPTHPGRFGKISRKADDKGAWTRYEYDLEGRKVLEVSTWLDGATDAPNEESMMAMIDYTCWDPRETPRLNDSRWRTKIQMTADNLVSTTYRAFYMDGDVRVEIEEEAAEGGLAYGDEANRKTIRRKYGTKAGACLRNKPLSVVHPDGTEDVWTYRTGNYVVSNNEAGVFSEQMGGAHIEVTETPKANLEEPCVSTKTVTIWDAFGREVQTETWVCTGSNQWERMDWQTISRDDFGRELVRRYANGLTTETTWGCCGKESETKPDGQSWSYVQDMLGRTMFSIKEDGPTEAAVYDAAGKVLSKTLFGGGLSLSTSNRYDLAGRLVESWDEAGLSTTIDYGERTETITRLGGATETTTRFRDGKVKSVSGTGVVPAYHEYGIGSDGGQWAITYTGSTNSPAWNLAVRDREGRLVRTEQPGFGGTVVTNTYEYDDDGRLVRESKTGSLDNLYVYDERGELFRSGMDVTTNGVLVLASMDRIREQRSEFILSGSNWLHQQTSILYPFDGSANAFTTSIGRTQIGGSGCACEAGGGETVDARGNVSTSQVSVEPLSRTVTKTLTRPGVANPETTVTSNGLLLARTLPAGAEYRYRYDGLGRQVGFVDPRTGTNHTAYLSNGRVDYVEDAAGYRTVFGYDPATGRRISITDAMTNTVHTAYDIQGRVTNTWGATYPVAYEYDAYGRMAAMQTWRDTNAAPDVTQWNYDEATGFLTNKVYADNLGPTYEYDAIGRLTKRIWARSVETEYAYDSLGQLTAIDYSDSTPDVTFSYGRLGRQLTITDVLGTRTNVFDALTLLEERLPDGNVLARSYDFLGRPSGIALDADYAVGYGYDEFGRFAAVAVSNGFQFDYTYVPDSPLLASWSMSNGAAVAYAFEPNRNLRTEVVNTFDGNPISSFAYTYDAIGRRTVRIDGAATPPSRTNTFDYNQRSELTGAVMPAPLPAVDTNLYAYAYDPIGNRQQASANEVTNLYQANELNQYTNINEGAVEPVYDADGNMTSLGGWQFTWDAENRLVKASPRVLITGSRIYDYGYDYAGRRVKKTERRYTIPAYTWTYRSLEYDGWNPIRERVEVGGVVSTNRYVWGLDLSGSLQGAGGVGGLLMQSRADGDSPWFCFCDANGNVTDLVDTNGSVVAHYEYDPYGNTVAQSGDQADANPYRFSTKYWDGETGFYYYGYRFYSPAFGRWASRDPIGERGGDNLYSTAKNSLIVKWDIFGLFVSETTCEISTNTFFELNPEWKQLIKDAENGNPPCFLEISCSCCGSRDKGTRIGTEEGGTKRSRVTICYNNADSETDLVGTIAHELTHHLDDCGNMTEYDCGGLSSKEQYVCYCAQSICKEMRAYMQQGLCNDGATCWALVKSRGYLDEKFCKIAASKGAVESDYIKKMKEKGCSKPGYPKVNYPKY